MINRRFPEDRAEKSEPEILPPGQTDFREVESRLRGKIPLDAYSFQRIHVAKIGPLGLLPFLLIGGFLAAVSLLFAVGIFFVLLPVAGFLLAGALVMGFLRGRSRWLR